ncbi:unnamed protein product [Vicia faba]|uniref:Uncharacterized protein n=1 Tax=Vicia faba TaxID=3906 RepID=A0AAV1BAI6_VICFA|nr:unnamed protein product [Vicia faba]
MILQASSLQFPATDITFIATSMTAARICNHELSQQLSSVFVETLTETSFCLTETEILREAEVERLRSKEDGGKSMYTALRFVHQKRAKSETEVDGASKSETGD